MTRTFDETNEIFSNLSEEIYEYMRIAAEEFYQFGTREKLTIASKLSGLTESEILAWW